MKAKVNGTAVKIEKGIPLPSGKNQARYPFSKMEIGDSFAVPKSEANRLRTSLNQYKIKTKDKAFATRTLPNEIRVWKIESI